MDYGSFLVYFIPKPPSDPTEGERDILFRWKSSRRPYVLFGTEHTLSLETMDGLFQDLHRYIIGTREKAN